VIEPHKRSYATATYRAVGEDGQTSIEHQRYIVVQTKSGGGFAVFDSMYGNIQVTKPFGSRKDAEEWMRTNTAP
jgi:hypothetical protein